IFVRNVKKQGNSLYVAMDDPTNEIALAEIAKAAGLPVKPMIACLSDIRNAIRVYYVESSEVAAVSAHPPAPPPPHPSHPPPPARDRMAAPPPQPVPQKHPSVQPPAPPPAHASPPPARLSQSGVPSPPPPAPLAGRQPLPTIADSAELTANRMSFEPPPSTEPAPNDPPSEDSPGAAPELEVSEYVPRSSRPR